MSRKRLGCRRRACSVCHSRGPNLLCLKGDKILKILVNTFSKNIRDRLANWKLQLYCVMLVTMTAASKGCSVNRERKRRMSNFCLFFLRPWGGHCWLNSSIMSLKLFTFPLLLSNSACQLLAIASFTQALISSSHCLQYSLNRTEILNTQSEQLRLHSSQLQSAIHVWAIRRRCLSEASVSGGDSISGPGLPESHFEPHSV